MKAKELMIGDWIHNKFIKTDYQVYPAFLSQATNFGRQIDRTLDEIECEPIPLQKIHLTKNGFKATNESDTVFRFEDGYVIEVEFDEGMPIANIDPSIFLRIEFAEKELFMPITYLHELQHAMKLFDIDWEIKL